MALPNAVIYCDSQEEHDILFDVLENDEHIEWSGGQAVNTFKGNFPRLNCYFIASNGTELMHSSYTHTVEGRSEYSSDYDIPDDMYLISLPEYLSKIGESWRIKSHIEFDASNLSALL